MTRRVLDRVVSMYPLNRDVSICQIDSWRFFHFFLEYFISNEIKMQVYVDTYSGVAWQFYFFEYCCVLYYVGFVEKRGWKKRETRLLQAC